MAVLLLSGLLDSYEAFVITLDTRPGDNLTLEYVKGKLDARAVEGTLVGFSEAQKGYRILKGTPKVKVS